MNILDILTDNIKNKIPVSFSKYGDGEYFCAFSKNHGDRNCDGDIYTDKLSEDLKISFRYMTQEMNNSYIGLWHDREKMEDWKKLVSNPDKIKWAEYHTFIVDVADFRNENLSKKIQLYKTIQEYDKTKIIVCNPLLEKLQYLVKSDHMINISFNNWFNETNLEKIIQICKNCIGDEEQPMIITSCGMGAKVLICELTKLYPKGIFLDFGSAPDFVCTKRDSRGRSYSYDTIYRAFKPILPSDWHDPKYEKIYKEARHKLGVHIG